MQETWILSLSPEDPLEKEMAAHSRILAWEIPWTEEPEGYSSWSRRRVRHDSPSKQQQCDKHFLNILQGNSCVYLGDCYMSRA